MKIVKRLLQLILVLVVLLVVVVGIFYVKIFTGQMPASSAALKDGTQPLLDGYVAAFAVPDGDNKVILVDCGNDKDAKALKAGLAGKTVAAIFLTHGHPDHVNGCNQFPGVPVYAMKAELDAIEGKEAFAGALPHAMGAKDSGLRPTGIDDGADIVVDAVHVHAFAAPGHTKGSAIYAINHTLFFGDASTATKDGKLEPPVGPFSDDQELGLRSLAAMPQKLAAAHVDGIDTFAFAHSGSIPADMKALAAMGTSS
ncbi:MAG TPA: MBL fold metallo-hydrolase [Myxococcota bacterium]|jgi:glyoxylase-like metal-dependent hydrolase (beta-lactamase superfamily II)